MSWIKRRGQASPNPAPVTPVPMYNPGISGHSEGNWQEAQNNWYTQQQQQQHFQHQQQPAEHYVNPSFNNLHQQQAFKQNTQHFKQYSVPQHTEYNQNNSVYQQQPLQPYGNLQYNQEQYVQNSSFPTQETSEDTWNWGWGDEDNSNNIQQNESESQRLNSGNVKSEESWNWAGNGTKSEDLNQLKQDSTDELFPRVNLVTNNQLMKSEPSPESNNISPFPGQTLDVLSASGKRGKLETPQWSVESQMSQESSDDVLPTSESDNHMLSRSSTISHSPISGHDSLPHKEEYNVKDNQLQDDSFPGNQMENKEILRTDSCRDMNQGPLLSQNPQIVPMLPPVSVVLDDTKNPYNRTNLMSHQKSRVKTTNVASFSQHNFNQLVNLETLPDNSEHPDSMPQHSTLSPLTKNTQQWQENNEVPINDRNQYLETGQLSENSQNDFALGDINIHSQEDALPPPGLRRMVLGQIEQNEIKPSNLDNFSDEPPPGLSRMVLGQTESTSVSNVIPDEDVSRLTFEPIEPPEGFHRMIPGESSSPESSLRQQAFEPKDQEEEDSEIEFNNISSQKARSATIGADTPPAISNPITNQSSLKTTNRSETIGADTPPEMKPTIQDNTHSKGAGVSSIENRNLGTNKKNKDQAMNEGSRRDYIEGKSQTSELTNIVNAVRNLTVGENSIDGVAPVESVHKKQSKHESTDSDHDLRGKSPRDPRDRLYKENRRGEREYSPDSYRDKRYDRRRYKDKRYEEDTDYYSDKEKDKRNRDIRDKEYEKRYHSLRKDKEKDKKRRDPRDYQRDPREYQRDPRRGEYYYGRYEEHYDNEPRSRPSSRSDSMHDSTYRDRRHETDPRDRRHKDRERDKHRRPRESFNPYMHGMGYDPYSTYYQQYQYYENLRRTNPQAYAEWYRKYYQQVAPHNQSYNGEDRASVHSGRSSANDELTKDRYTRQSYYSQASLSHLGGYCRESQTHSSSGRYGLDDSSYARPLDQTDSLTYDQTTVSQRLTPAKFATTHVKATIASGKLIKILPQYPSDGQAAFVDIIGIETLLSNDEEYKELTLFPGPLVKGVTHKKTIIEYCETKIRTVGYNDDIVDPEACILMWELLILLIRQNGMVVGADIAELLLKNRKELLNRPPSVLSSISSNAAEIATSENSNQHLSEITNGSTTSVLKEEDVTNKFREYLLYGSVKEALEWAMKHGLWGHALFLASKLDKRTYANVMMRFANGLTMNDPLQTLYQLLSGRMPAAVMGVADEKWGDWRPHLAMILSNSTQRPELNCKAITSLGDTLMGRGSLYAAQFCYLMAEVGFSRYGDDNAKMVLLGSNHSKPFLNFATNEAMHMTEIYEYACSLNDSSFALPEFQPYKYLLATRLADRGLLEQSLAYLEKISVYIVQNPTLVQSSLVNNVCKLADKLKYYDPVGDAEEEEEFGANLDISRPDNSWLKDLRLVQNDFNLGLIPDSGYNNSCLEDETQQVTYESPQQDAWHPPPAFEPQYQQNVPQQQWQPDQPVEQLQEEYHHPEQQQEDYTSGQFQDQQQFWPNQQQWNVDQPNDANPVPAEQQLPNFYATNAQSEDVPRPQISMPNQSKGRSTYNDESSPKDSKKDASSNQAKPLAQEKAASTGWFGGIFGKLALKPKNQMKLPDDKNPRIVWDEEKKRWINVDEGNNETVSEFKPPPPSIPTMAPKITQPPNRLPSGPIPAIQSNYSTMNNQVISQPDMNNMMNQSLVQPGNEGPNSNDGPPSLQPNMFKLQRKRDLKKSYIDIFNPGGPVKGPTSLPNMGNFAAMPSATPQMNFFIPQPVSDPNAPTDFLTQTSSQIEDPAQ